MYGGLWRRHQENMTRPFFHVDSLGSLRHWSILQSILDQSGFAIYICLITPSAISLSQVIFLGVISVITGVGLANDVSVMGG